MVRGPGAVARETGEEMQAQSRDLGTYKRYPLRNVLMYNGTTVAHFALGCLGIILGYDRWPRLGWVLGLVYLVFALAQMYLLMPLMVCPSCVYRRLGGSRCVSALNLVSARLVAPTDADDFPNRGKGGLCHNNLYIASLATPLVLMLPALVLNFSALLLGIFVVIVGLFAFRMFVLFPRFACGCCAARRQCPNAKAMGLSS
jgi:hypothetical protein